MLKTLLKPAFKAMPAVLQLEIQYQRNQVDNKKIIAAWEQAGKPVPPPHAVKQRLIRRYRQETGYQILVETGTLTGGMIEAQRKHFTQIYSIELSHKLWSNAVKKFKPYKHIHLIHGDSGQQLFALTDQLTHPAIFWLDGHYSAGDTAMGDVLCPVVNELKAILRNRKLQHVILIDDARNFNGTDSYPTLAQIEDILKQEGRAYRCIVEEDVIQIVLLP